MRILVTGAGGFVGRHLVPRLRADGHDVVTLKRGPGPAAGNAFNGPAELADLDAFPHWPSGVEAVVHLAALNPSRHDPSSRDLGALRRANVDGTAALARRAAREGARRVVLLGSSAVHAPAGGRPVAEGDEPAPGSPYAVSKAEAEAAFRDALGNGATRGVVLRPAPVFGPGAKNLTAALARLARTPLPLPLDGFGDARSLVSVDSLIDAIRLALTAPAAAGGTFLVADDEALTPAEVVSALREGAGRRPMILPAPVGLAMRVARLLGKGEAAMALARGLVIDSTRIRDALGWRPQNAADALRRMAADRRL